MLRLPSPRAILPAGLTRPIRLARGWRWVLSIGLALLMFWTSLGWWLPPLLTNRIATLASEQLGEPVHIGRLHILPWLLQLSVDDLRIGSTEAPLLRLKRALVDLSIRSLWNRAPIIEALQLTDPVVHLTQSADGVWNVSPLIARFNKPSTPPTPSSAPLRFALAHVALINGRVVFDDGRAGVVQHVDDLNLFLPALSTLPGAQYRPAEPRLTARVDGSALALQAQSAVFVSGIPTRISLNWQGIDLAKLVTATTPYLPPNLPITLNQGQLGFDLIINTQQATAPDAPGMLSIIGQVAVNQLALTLPDQGVAQQFRAVQLNDLSVDIPDQQIHLGRLLLDEPGTTVNLATALAARAGTAQPQNASSTQPASTTSAPPNPVENPATAPAATSAPPTPSWHWAIDQIELNNGKITLSHPDWHQPQGWQNLNATLAQVHDPASSTLPTAFTLSAQSMDAVPAQLALTGVATVAPTPRIILSTVRLKQLDLARWIRPWAKMLPVDLESAIVSLDTQAQWQPDQWRIHQGRLSLNTLRLTPSGKPDGDTVACSALTIEGITASGSPTTPAQITLVDLAASELAVQATRNTRGQWLADLQPAASRPPSTPAPKTRSAPRAKTSPAASTTASIPRIVIDHARCTDCALTLIDQSVRPVSRLGLKHLDFTAKQLDSTQLNRAIPFTLRAQSLTQGKLVLAGQIQPKPLAVKADVSIDALELAPVQPYLDPFVNIRLQSAALSAKGKFTLAGTEKTPLTQAAFSGNGGLNRVFVRDRLTNSPFLRWQSLTLQKMAVRWSPAGMETDLGRVQLDQFFGRLIINADGHLNLSDIVKTQKNEATRSVTQVAPEPQNLPAGEAKASLAANPSPPPKLRWQHIGVRGGQIDFTDHFIKPNYSAKVTGLTGSVSALAWDQPKEASIDLAGRVDGSAPVAIKGQANPLARPLALDITADTQGIELTRLSTYAARYAGYGIEKGSLSATLHYAIKDNELTASNHIVLDQLTFGAPVESPDATKLPVLLAVSLLQDRNGVIDIELPISGTLTDPEFSVGGIIVKVIVNLLTKAVTAPFSLLASAFGGSEENLAVLPFEPGSDALGAKQTAQLDTLVKALNDRPQLKLDITGFADPAVDTDGLKNARLRHELRAAKAKATDQPIDSVEITPEETARWLAVVYGKAKLKDKPKNLVGLTKTVPEEEMRQRLLAGITITPQELEKLADLRTDAVREYLTAPGRIAPTRVGLTASHLGTQDQKGDGSTARVQFSLH